MPSDLPATPTSVGPRNRPRQLMVVSRNEPELYAYLVDAFAEIPEVAVAYDRREGERRRAPQAIAIERRQRERRIKGADREITLFGWGIVHLDAQRR